MGLFPHKDTHSSVHTVTREALPVRMLDTFAGGRRNRGGGGKGVIDEKEVTWSRGVAVNVTTSTF